MRIVPMKREGSVSCLANKFGAKTTITEDGMKFDSKKEYKRYCELMLLERAGKISGLERQPKFELIPTQYEESTEVYKSGAKKGQPKPGYVIERSCTYVGDFAYWQDGKYIVEDVKGYQDPRSAAYAKFVIKRKLMLWVHGIQVKEV